MTYAQRPHLRLHAGGWLRSMWIPKTRRVTHENVTEGVRSALQPWRKSLLSRFAITDHDVRAHGIGRVVSCSELLSFFLRSTSQRDNET